MDHNDRALRMVKIGLNEHGKTINGFERNEGFDISAASELMAIIALAKILKTYVSALAKLLLLMISTVSLSPQKIYK